VPPAVSKGLKSYVQANLVPILEAVSHRLRGAVYPDMYFFDDMVLDAGGEGLPRKADDTQARVIYLGAPCFVVNSHPDFRGGLGCEAVESQCREKADYSSRHPLACFDEAVVLSQLSFACDIETPSNFLELATTLKTKEILARNVVLRKVAGAQYSRMLYKRHHLVFGRVGHLHILGRYE